MSEELTFADKIRTYAATGVPITMDAAMLYKLARMSEDAHQARDDAMRQLDNARRLLRQSLIYMGVSALTLIVAFGMWVAA